MMQLARDSNPPAPLEQLQRNYAERLYRKRCLSYARNRLSLMAEREGFEPPNPRGSTVFKTAAFDHSATSPRLFVKRLQVVCLFEIVRSVA
jgi:hypothetical protein